MIHEIEVRASEDGMGIRREDFRTFPTVGEAIQWALHQRPFGYRRGWIDNLEIDMNNGRLKYPERADERTLREFDRAWRELRSAA